KPHDSGELPSTREQPHCRSFECWRLINRRDIEDVTAIRRWTICAVIAPIVGDRVILAGNGEFRICQVADAMRQRVICLNSEAFCLTPLNRNDKAVIASG